MILRLIVVLLVAGSVGAAPSDRVFYAGGAGKERFYGTYQLSDGTVLVAGVADDLNWVPAGVPKTQLSATALNGSTISNQTSTSSQVGFILHLSGDLSTLLRVVHFAPGAVNEVRHIKAATPPFASPTGALFISGSRGAYASTTSAGYYVARLNANFVSGAPTALSWVLNVDARNSSEYFELQPWDVQSDGKVVLTLGKPYDSAWCEIIRVAATPSATGNPYDAADPVPGWRAHNLADGTKFYGTMTDYAGTSTPVRSWMIMKTQRTTDSGLQRSFTAADYQRWERDEAGYWRKGRYPLDMFWKDYWYWPSTGVTNNYWLGDARGYDGAWYRLSGTASSDGAPYTQRIGALVIDKRNNHLYIGSSAASRLPDGNPDYEPYVMALDGNGYLKWWCRLYKEYDDNGPTAPSSVNTNLVRLSTPDQYVDGLAVDYTAPLDGAGYNGILYVLARSHGNNVVNFWNGSNSFHNTFTGTQGNIHLSWIGKLRDNRSNAVLQAASWCAEYAEGTGNLGTAYTDPNLDLWPSHNSGWPDLNTTRMRQTMWVNNAGQVCVLAREGRRTITTRNAYQRNVRPQINATLTGVISASEFICAGLTNANLIVSAGCTNRFTSGANNGVARNITGFDNATGRITVSPPYANLPAVGDTVRIHEGVGQWNAFVRVFSTNLNTLVYSSLLTSQINPVNGSGAGNNTELHGLFPIANGVLVAGFHVADAGNVAVGNPVPVQNVPAWGTNAPAGESALLARLLFSEPGGTPSASVTAPVSLAGEQGPVTGLFQLALSPPPAGGVTVQVARAGTASNGVDYAALPASYVFGAGQALSNLVVIPLPDTLAEGDETVQLTVVAGNGYTVGSPASAVVTIQDKPMDAWRVVWFAGDANNPAIACDGCDPDGDGLANLLEYAFGFSPLAGDSGLPGAVVEDGYLTLGYPRVKAATDVVYRPEVTGDLGTAWTNQVVTVSVTDQGATEWVKVRDTVPITAAGRRFLRVRVLRP